MVASRSREQEYAADAAAKSAGYGEALHAALTYLGDFEGGRSGWEQVVAATHPEPTHPLPPVLTGLDRQEGGWSTWRK